MAQLELVNKTNAAAKAIATAKAVAAAAVPAAAVPAAAVPAVAKVVESATTGVSIGGHVGDYNASTEVPGGVVALGAALGAMTGMGT